MVDGGLISGFFWIFSMVFVENGGFGASPVRTSVASFPAFFFLFNVTFEKKLYF